MYQVKDYYKAIDSFAPFATAEPWDNAGLPVGGMELPASRALLALDLTGAVLDEAIELGVELVITHHPPFLEPLARLDAGRLPYRAVRAGISVISAHTNLDIAGGGVNDALAEQLGLKELSPLMEDGLGRIGILNSAMPPERFAAFVKERLGARGLRLVAGEAPVSRVAVCGGSGGNLIADAVAKGADAFVTADVKHHQLLEAKELGLTLIDGGHFATENAVMAMLRERLMTLLPGAELHLSNASTDGAYYL